MSKFVRGVRIWGSDGQPRYSAGLGRATAADLDALRAAAAPHVQQALEGHVADIPFEVGSDSLECTFAPLVDESGKRDGAVAVAVDAAERRRTEATLRDRLAFEELITNLSTQLVSVGVESVDEGVNDALRAIGEFAHVDRAYVFYISGDGSAMSNTHEWCAPGIDSTLELMQNQPLAAFPWWTKRLLHDRQLIHVADLAALPPEAAAEKDTLLEQGVKSILCLPMIYERSVVGFLGFDAVRSAKTWPAADVVLLRIAGEIVVSALQRKRAEERRRVLETQLIQARSLENVARLAGGVAHDFNNLLAVVLNYATLLRRDLQDPQQQAKMTELYEAARRAAELTRQLLMVGRRAVDEPMYLDVNSIIVGLETLVKQALGESIELRLALGEDLGVVKMGLPQLEQIFLNLAMNARDAMTNGGELVIETSEVEIDASYAARFVDLKVGRYLRLRVRDAGCGMTAEVASRAFEPFFTTKEQKGTGLGLSTVHGIVEQAGGHVTLASALGQGTTVDVFLPVVVDAVAADARPPSEGDQPKGRGELLLVVEDSAPLRKLVVDMLTSNGYRVLEASTGQQALEVLARHRRDIELLLTDVIMPQMSGRDLAVRARKEFDVSRVVYMSGYPADIVAHHGVLEAGTHLLQKPFLEADLLRLLRSVLEE